MEPVNFSGTLSELTINMAVYSAQKAMDHMSPAVGKCQFLIRGDKAIQNLEEIEPGTCQSAHCCFRKVVKIFIE
uniref:Uncharacterized protein n=1 Tax=Pararge aegeria TaxID=116150 RepID=S4P5U9_9NEOP